MLKQHAHYILPVILALSLLALPSAQAEWTAPSTLPPGGNPPLPLNVGSVGQEKAGDLTIAGLGTFLSGVGVVNSSLGITDASLKYKIILNPANLEPVAGKVLTALDDQGNATWADPASNNLSLDGGHFFVSNTSSCAAEEGAVPVTASNNKTLCFVGDK